MSVKTPELISRQWQDFQKGLTAAHGTSMANKEAIGIIEDLLVALRKDSLTNHLRTYVPKDLIVLSGLLAASSGSGKTSAPATTTSKRKDAAAASIAAL